MEIETAIEGLSLKDEEKKNRMNGNKVILVKIFQPVLVNNRTNWCAYEIGKNRAPWYCLLN